MTLLSSPPHHVTAACRSCQGRGFAPGCEWSCGAAGGPRTGWRCLIDRSRLPCTAASSAFAAASLALCCFCRACPLAALAAGAARRPPLFPLVLLALPLTRAARALVSGELAACHPLSARDARAGNAAIARSAASARFISGSALRRCPPREHSARFMHLPPAVEAVYVAVWALLRLVGGSSRHRMHWKSDSSIGGCASLTARVSQLPFHTKKRGLHEVERDCKTCSTPSPPSPS